MMQSSPLNFRRAVIWIGRLVLGGIFVYAGLSKLIFPNTHLWPMFVLRFSISDESFELRAASGIVQNDLARGVASGGAYFAVRGNRAGFAAADRLALANLGDGHHGDHGGVPGGCDSRLSSAHGHQLRLLRHTGEAHRHDRRPRRRLRRARACHDHLRVHRSSPAAPLVRPRKGPDVEHSLFP